MAEFFCSDCGRVHEGLLKDIAAKLPDCVFELPDAERSARARWNTDICEMDGRAFIRGVLYLPFVGRDDQFGWGVWAEVEQSVFERYRDLFREDATAEALHPGQLANKLGPYQDVTIEPLWIKFGTKTERPTFHTYVDSPTSLGTDQRCGIDDRRWHELLGERFDAECHGEYTCSVIADGLRPVLEIYHEHDGDWQFVCGCDDCETHDVVSLHKEHLIARDKTIADALDLPCGWRAVRERPNDAWLRQSFEQEEEHEA